MSVSGLGHSFYGWKVLSPHLAYPPEVADCDRTASNHPQLFDGISPPVYTEICRAGRVLEFVRGEVLHLEADRMRRVMLLTSGSVKLTKIGRTGSEVILRVAGSGDFLGTEGLLGYDRYCATAQVFQRCRVLIWEIHILGKLLERYPVVRHNMMLILEAQLRELEDRFREVATERVGARVGLQLLRLVKTMGRPGQGGIEIPLSREELAQMTGTTLFTVSRLLSAWEMRGAVKARRNAVVICGVELLSAICEEESPE